MEAAVKECRGIEEGCKLERELAEAQVTLRRMKADLDCAEENFHVTNQAYVKADNALSQAKRDAEREPVWIVNDLGELGVKIGHRFLFLYKGDNLEYETGKHDDGSQMMWRIVGKREFGECCYPLRWITNRYSEDRYRENPVFTPGLSFGKPEDGEWKQLPAALAKREGEGGKVKLVREMTFVYQRLVCAFRGHDFKKAHEDRIVIVYCARCNWYGGPTGAGHDLSR